MKDSGELKYEESDDIALKGVLAEHFLEEDDTLEDLTSLSQGGYVIFNPEEIEDNTVTPGIHSCTYPTYPFHYSVPWSTTCIVAKPETYFYQTGGEEISGSGIYTIKTDVEILPAEEFIISPRLNNILKVLQEVYQECLEPNWDGYNASPITHETYSEANKILKLIPPSFPLPDILPEPDGEIGLEWYKEKDFVFSISLGGKNIITYAGLFGKNNEVHGTEYFTDSIPKTILDFLRRLFPSIK